MAISLPSSHIIGETFLQIYFPLRSRRQIDSLREDIAILFSHVIPTKVNVVNIYKKRKVKRVWQHAPSCPGQRPHVTVTCNALATFLHIDNSLTKFVGVSIPVNMKVIAIGRNYTEHAKELNNPVPDKPVIFLKPDTAVTKDNKDFYYPEFSKNIHYEVEVLIRICKEGKHVNPKFASTYYDAIGLGIDFTARDIQDEQKKKGLPWELAKAFDGSAPVSDWLPKADFPDTTDIDFSLKKNGDIVQEGNTKDMIFSFEDIIVFVSQYITLRKGDIIFTGTPAGVGAIAIGDKLEGFIADKTMFKFSIK